MADFFWDTSALVKHYHPELGTSKVDELLQTAASRHAISRLGVTETFSVFAGKVRAGRAPSAGRWVRCSHTVSQERQNLGRSHLVPEFASTLWISLKGGETMERGTWCYKLAIYLAKVRRIRTHCFDNNSIALRSSRTSIGDSGQS
jgi:hypothetical protein